MENNHTDLCASLTDQDEINKAVADYDSTMDKMWELRAALNRIQEYKQEQKQNEEKAENERKAKEDKADQEKIRKEKMEMEERLEKERIAKGYVPPNNNTPRAAASKPKLPQLTLPIFDGKYEDWLPFRDRFNQAVHSRTDLSNSEKFTYLLSSLTRRPAEVVKAISLNDSNYAIAHDRMTKLFEHSQEIAFKLADNIIELPRITTRTSDSIISMRNTVSNALASITSLNSNINLGELLVIRHPIRKMDQVTLERFHQSLDDTDIPPLQKLWDFLDKEMRVLDASNPGASNPTNSYPKPNGSTRTYQTHSKPETFTRKCLICNIDHPHFKCPKLAEASEGDRKKIVEKAKLCTNCLGTGHIWKECKSTRNCKTCNQKHHSLLHGNYSKATTKPTTLTTHTVNDTSVSIKLKPTAIVNLTNQAGQGVSCRTLIDNCSDACFIQESLVRELGLPKQKLAQKQVFEALQNHTVSTATDFVTLEITSRYHSQVQFIVKAFIIQRIGRSYPQRELDATSWSHIPYCALTFTSMSSATESSEGSQGNQWHKNQV
ncbi:unnamed protein product [Allacma fusca]|uniref:Gag-pol polyprotein n=1 Tax=Allacma fusca TaxID=39272 RepID=A0A8J2P5M1_9HEXA|nr:unnamed protein product [Allacma fusca]